MKRALLALGCLLLAIGAAAQESVRLEFPSAGPREIWIAQSPPESEPKDAIRTEGGLYELKAPNPGLNDGVAIWDKKTGNLAFKPLREIKGTWTLTAADFRFVLRLDVRVEHKGRPVESASVQLRDGRQDVSRILDSTGKGVVSFWAVRPGAVKIAVTYSSKGQTKEPLKQTFDLGLKRENAVPVFVVNIADELATVAEAPRNDETQASGLQDSGGAKPTPGAKGDVPVGNDTTNPFGGIVSFLIAVIVAAILVFFGMKWMRQNQSLVQEKLEAIGVQIPEPKPDADGSSTVNTPIVPAPPEKIILDGADPSAAVSAPVGSVHTPRLVGVSGTFELPEGETTVSRELGGIVLPGETSVSRRHATLIRNGESVIVRDDGSTNGTLVNMVRIEGPTELRVGDAVQFGAVAFRFEI